MSGGYVIAGLLARGSSRILKAPSVAAEVARMQRAGKSKVNTKAG